MCASSRPLPSTHRSHHASASNHNSNNQHTTHPAVTTTQAHTRVPSADRHFKLINEFELLQCVGKGSFGCVYLVRHVKHEVVYIMKQIDISIYEEKREKQQLKEKQQQQHLRQRHHPTVHADDLLDEDDTSLSSSMVPTHYQEVKYLKLCSDHPFICQYITSFYYTPDDESAPAGTSSSSSSKKYLCIIMEYYAEGDLGRKIKERREELAKLNAKYDIPASHAAVSSSEASLLRDQSERRIHFSEQTVLDYFVQLCLGIKHIHNQHLIHRDLKPSNIFLCVKPRVDNTAAATSSTVSSSATAANSNEGMIMLKIGDFGISRRVHRSSRYLARTRVGSPYFMAPEVLSSSSSSPSPSPGYGASVDVWSAGICLYEMCALKHAWPAKGLSDLMKQVSSSPLPSLPSSCHYSPRIQFLLTACTHKVPELRPTIHQLLTIDFLRKRIPTFLSARRIKLEVSSFSLSLCLFVSRCCSPLMSAHGLPLIAVMCSLDVNSMIYQSLLIPLCHLCLLYLLCLIHSLFLSVAPARLPLLS